MTTLYLIRGLPGSGKSSLAKNLEHFAIRVEADDFFLDHEGNYNFGLDNYYNMTGKYGFFSEKEIIQYMNSQESCSADQRKGK